jgi:hypothetical protein
MNIKKAIASLAICGFIVAVPITQRLTFNYNLKNINKLSLPELKLNNTSLTGRTGGCVMRTFSCVVDRSGKCQK